MSNAVKDEAHDEFIGEKDGEHFEKLRFKQGPMVALTLATFVNDSNAKHQRDANEGQFVKFHHERPRLGETKGPTSQQCKRTNRSCPNTKLIKN